MGEQAKKGFRVGAVLGVVIGLLCAGRNHARRITELERRVEDRRG